MHSISAVDQQAVALSGLPITDGVSVVCAVKNRSENLRQALPTWVQNAAVDEVILVDWDSDESVEDIVNEHQNGKIVLVRVPHQPKWLFSQTFNLAVRFASKARILRVDADILLAPTFFQKYQLHPGTFFAGNWRIAQNENETYLNGQAYFYRQDFLDVNGYDERLLAYGWADDELYYRLEYFRHTVVLSRILPYPLITRIRRFFPQRLQRKDILPGDLIHIPHDDALRLLQMTIQVPGCKSSITLNRRAGRWTAPWSNKYHMWDFSVKRLRTHTFLCEKL